MHHLLRVFPKYHWTQSLCHPAGCSSEPDSSSQAGVPAVRECKGRRWKFWRPGTQSPAALHTDPVGTAAPPHGSAHSHCTLNPNYLAFISEVRAWFNNLCSWINNSGFGIIHHLRASSLALYGSLGFNFILILDWDVWIYLAFWCTTILLYIMS